MMRKKAWNGRTHYGWDDRLPPMVWEDLELPARETTIEVFPAAGGWWTVRRTAVMTMCDLWVDMAPDSVV